MALQIFNNPVAWMPFWGGIGAVTTSLGSDSTFIMNGAADKMAFVFQASSTTPPDQIKFRATAYTSTGTIDVTIETVDATTGFPSGTLVTNTNTASVSVASTGTKTVTGLSGTGALVVGDAYAIVLTATAGFAGNFTLLRTTGGNGGSGFPLSLTKDSAGAWTKVATANVGYAIGFFTSAGASINMPGFSGAYTAALQAYSDSTNPDERGSRFTLPFPTTCYGAMGVVVCGSAPADVNSFSVSLYSSHTSGSPTLLATATFDGDNQGSQALRALMFPAPVDLAANTVYALVVKATSTTGVSLVKHTYAASAELGTYIADTFYATTRNNASGAFADTNTEAYSVYPLLGKFDDGVGGGGGGLAMSVSGRNCS